MLGAVGLAILGGGGMSLALRRRRRARRSLRQLVAEQPELHPALAYAVGCLRHELLKHRIGAALAALARVGEAPEDARLREFVRARVAGDEPLGVAWKGHLGALERSLGGRVRIEASDARFRAAGGAVRRLARLAPALLDGRGGPVRRGLAEVRAELASFDAYLGGLLGELVRARVDGDFLAKVVESVRRELGEEAAGLDELAVAPPPEPVRVEMYGIDLRIILRNLLRNAIQAALVGGAPRRVRLDVTLALEPTGERGGAVAGPGHERGAPRARGAAPEPGAGGSGAGSGERGDGALRRRAGARAG